MTGTREFESKFYEQVVTSCMFQVSDNTLCNKPLGFDSRSMDYGTCKEHRNCSLCGMILSPLEVSVSLSHNKLVCYRCHTMSKVEEASGKPINEQKLDTDLANLSRLILHPDTELSVEANQSNLLGPVNYIGPQMSHERLHYIAAQCEATAAYVRLFLQRSPAWRDEKLEISKKQKKKYQAAKDHEAENNKPVAEILKEKREEKVASKEQRAEAKIQEALKERGDSEELKLFLGLPGITREQAIAMYDAQKKRTAQARKDMLR